MREMNTTAASSIYGMLFMLFALGLFLAALVVFAIITLLGAATLGIVMIIGLALLWFGPSGWKPFIMMGMILVLGIAVILLLLK